MEKYEKERPNKIFFSISEQNKLIEKTKEYVLRNFSPFQKIDKIILFGSLAKGTFGKYEKEWKHGFYSDIDLLLLVENDYNIPEKWKVWFKHNKFTVFTCGKIDHKYLIQYMVWKRKQYEIIQNQIDVEKWGIPLLMEKGKNKFIVLYEKK